VTAEPDHSTEEIKLGDLCKRVTVGHVGTMADQYKPAGIPFLRSQDIQPFSINTGSIKFIDDDFNTKLRKSILSTNDVVIVRTGYPGTAAVVPPELDGANCADLVILTPGPCLDSWFVAALLNSTWGRSTIAGNLVGVAQQHFNVGAAKALRCRIPDLCVQRRIGQIIKTYCDLIEVNTRRIAILDEIAHRVFDEWFVKFRFPTNSPAAIIQTGEIHHPLGWHTSKVKELVERKKAGKIYRKEYCNPSGEVIVVDQSTDEVLGFHSHEPDHRSTPESPLIVFGDHTCKIQLLISPFSVGQNTVVINAKPEVSIYYLFELVRGLTKTVEYKRHWNELIRKEVIVAPQELTEIYASIVRPCFELSATFRNMNSRLRTARDLLLPKLISGEIDVLQAERPVDVDVSRAAE
jgi:type I restriction enzyme S subunit